MTENEFISTGIKKLDQLLGGGIIKGFTTLLLGSPGSSIEILTKQIASTGKTLYITTEENEEEIRSTIERFGWKAENINFVDIAKKYSQSVLNREKKRVGIYKQKSKKRIKELISMGSRDMPSYTNVDENFLTIFLNNISSSSSEKILINSIDFFLNKYAEEEVMRILHSAKIKNLENKGALFIAMQKGIHGNALENKIESISDCVLELEVLRKGSSFDRFLAVKKMRNYAKKIGMARYVIDSDGFVLEMIERIM